MALLCAAQHAWAQGNFTWDGGGTDNNWTTAANWNPDGAPGSPQNNLNFAGSTRLTPNNNFGNYSAGYRIFFNSGASSFTQGGNPIKFFDFMNREVTRITEFAKTPESGRPHVTVSPDGEWLLYAQLESDTADIMLVENFR